MRDRTCLPCLRHRQAQTGEGFIFRVCIILKLLVNFRRNERSGFNPGRPCGSNSLPLCRIWRSKSILCRRTQSQLYVALDAGYIKDEILSGCILWFLGNLVIESSIIPLEIIFEHRVYLPALLLILAITTGVYRYLKPRGVSVVILGVVVAVLSFWTHERNMAWADRSNPAQA